MYSFAYAGAEENASAQRLRAHLEGGFNSRVQGRLPDVCPVCASPSQPNKPLWRVKGSCAATVADDVMEVADWAHGMAAVVRKHGE